MLRPQTRGFVLYLFLGALVIMGCLVFGLETYSRQQNLSAHRVSYGQVSEALARSAITVVMTRFRENTRFPGRLLALLSGANPPRLAALIKSRPEEINDRFRWTESDSDRFFREVLGPDYRYPIDQLASEVPGSKVEAFVSIRALPLFQGVGLDDPVEKKIDLTITGRASLMGVTRRVKCGVELKVVNPIPPLCSKFSLFVAEADDNYNLMRNDFDGTPNAEAGYQPLVLYNTPTEDWDTGFDDRKLMADASGSKKQDPLAVREALRRRGFVYIGSTSPVILNMTAGYASPGYLDEGATKRFGELFHVFSARQFADRNIYYTVNRAPPFFNGIVDGKIGHDRRTENDTHIQYPFLSQTPFGFCEDLANDPDQRECVSDQGRSSLLHLYGDVSRPSRTVVFGPVKQAVYRQTRIGVEAVAKDGVGGTVRAPTWSNRKETPLLKCCPSSTAFDTDVAAEQQGQDPIYLARIRSEYAPHPPTVNPFALVPEVYTHTAMFPGKFDQYRAFMCSVDASPYDMMADAMLYNSFYPPSEGGSSFQSIFERYDKDYSFYQAARDLELSYSDSLHLSMNARTHYKGNLPDFFRSGAKDPAWVGANPVEEILLRRVLREVPTQAEFMNDYCRGQVLVLNDCVKIVDGGLDLPPLRFQGSGMILVAKGDISSQGLSPVSAEVPHALTLATLDGDIRLASGTTHVASFVTLTGSIRVSGGSGVPQISGTLASKKLSGDDIRTGAVVMYPSYLDPTREDHTESFRYIDHYLLAMGTVPVSVERLP